MNQESSRHTDTVHSILYTIHSLYTVSLALKLIIMHNTGSYFSACLLICICFQNNRSEEYFK